MSTEYRLRSFTITMTAIALAFPLYAGCGGSRSASSSHGTSAESLSIKVDRSENGAAINAPTRANSEFVAPPREFAFSVVGTAPHASSKHSTEARAAASQAAIIDAFGAALREARKSRGQPTSDYTAKIGANLTVMDRTTGDTRELTVCLRYRGVDNTIIVRDGILQQPPVDFRLIRRLFDETNGEFSLLATDTSSRDGLVLATVGCYVPPGFENDLKPENIARAPVDEP